jgi:uncharacterized protein YqfA (UPF0365 family)
VASFGIETRNCGAFTMNDLSPDAAIIFNLTVAGLGLVLVLVASGMLLLLFPAWFRSFVGGAPVMVMQIIAMRLRGVPPGLVVDGLVTLVHRGFPHDLSRVRLAETIYLAQRGLVDSPAQLADLMEKQLKASAA